jgi:hypothetical protein
LWECQSRLLLNYTGNLKFGGRFQLQGLICGTRPVEVKVKII